MNIRNLKNIIFFLFLFSIITGYSSVFSQDLNTKNEIDKLLQEADYLTFKESNHQKALDKLQSAYKLDEKNYDVLWRLSRTYIYLGRNLPYSNEEDQKKKLRMFARSFQYAQKAIEINPDVAVAFTYRAMANKYMALIKGIFGETDRIKLIKFDCERAIQIDPQDHLAYYIYGSLHAKLSEEPKLFRWPFGLDWANIESAILLYESAISIRPDIILYRLDCAIAYIEVENYQKAKEYLNYINSLQNQDEYDEVYKRKAREIYERIKYK
jgi:tetratricopeptide (TPR) repeat protein